VLGEREQENVVGAVVVALDVELPRDLDRGGQDLEGNVALDEPRHVDMAPVGPPEEISSPEQRIGVKVDHAERGMEGPGPIRGRIGRRPMPAIEPAFGARHEGATERPAPGGQPERGGRPDRRRDAHRDPSSHETIVCPEPERSGARMLRHGSALGRRDRWVCGRRGRLRRAAGSIIATTRSVAERPSVGPAVDERVRAGFAGGRGRPARGVPGAGR
jgi:hypothetical protein